MIELNDNNISQLVFENLKTDDKLKFVIHGDIYQYESEFYINGIFKDDDENYYISYLPLKTLSAFPLGSIFVDKKITSENVVKNIIDIRLNLNMKQTGYSKISDIEKVKDKIVSKIPDEISGYRNQRNIVLNQYLAIYKDQLSGKTVYIPHYEIARWFYLRSSSLTRQALSINLEGLYYEAGYTDSEHFSAEILMKHGSNNDDAAEIFRFAKDEFANIMFKNFGLDLSASKFNNTKETKYNCRSRLRANFPIHGTINFKIRGFHIDQNSIFVYQFLEEDSSYPFDELTVYRFRQNTKKEKEAIINKKSVNKEEMTKVLNSETPSSEYENLTTNNDVVPSEYRRGLEEKLFKFAPLLRPDQEDESIEEYKTKVSGIDLELSLSDSSGDGNPNLVHTSFVQDSIKENDEFIERENNLTVFRRVMFKIVDIDKVSQNPLGISVNIIDHANLPRKPKDYKGKAKWLKSMLDNGLPRQYMIAKVSTRNKEIYVIEIEKSDESDNLSTLILNKSGTALHTSSLYSVVRNYVESSGRWIIDSDINKFFIYHTGGVENRAKRIYKKIISI